MAYTEATADALSTGPTLGHDEVVDVLNELLEKLHLNTNSDLTYYAMKAQLID